MNRRLIPVRARINRSSDIPFEAIPLGKIVGAMEGFGDRINIVMIDACRDNPYSRGWRSSSMRGLAPFQLGNGEGTFISFATASGNVAADGNGRNSPYTAGVLQHIQTPNLSIETMFNNVRKTVFENTRGKQRPREDNSLIGTFSFNPTKSGIPAPAQPIQNPRGTAPKTPPSPIVDGTSSESTASEFLRKGQEKSKNNKHKEALLDYNQAIQINPQFAAAYYMRAQLYSEDLKEYRKAIIDYDRAIQINPNYYEAYSARGSSKFNLKDGYGAIADYNQAIRLNPVSKSDELSYLYHLRGKIQFSLLDWNSAIQSFGEEIRISSSHYAYWFRGRAYSKVGNLNQAILDYTEAIKKNGEVGNAEYYTDRAISYESLGRKKEAIMDFREAVKLYSRSFTAIVGERSEVYTAKFALDRINKLQP